MNQIEINGKSYPIKFGLEALHNFCAKNGLSVDDIQDMPKCLQGGLLRTVDLIFFGLQYGAKREKIEFDVTWEDVEAWLSDNPGLYRAALDTFGESQAPPVEGKKKAEEAPVS